MRTCYRFPPRARSAGFTLIELLLVMVLLGILGAVGSSMISDSFSVTRMLDSGNASEAEARSALERLAREIREVKRLGSGSLCIDTRTETQLVFRKADAGSSDLLGCATESNTVTITFAAPDLTLGYSSPGAVSATLTSRLAAGGFTYLQRDGTSVATGTTDLHFVRIDLTVSDATSGQSLPLRMRVALRNIP